MVNEFLNDTKEYNIFSYEDYKSSSLALKLKKIELLNEYYKLIYKKEDKLPVFIDFDGVILDTMEDAKVLLQQHHDLDWNTISRDNAEQQALLANFFKSLNWHTLLSGTREINESINFLKLIKDSVIYKPTIYSAINSLEESNEKHEYIEENIFGIDHKFTMAHTPKVSDDKRSILIDDDNFNLNNWDGYPVHFDSKIESIYPTINDLGELYFLFYYHDDNFCINNELKEEYKKIKVIH